MAAVLVILVLDRPLSHVYWLNVADRSLPFVGVIEHTNLIPPEHYDGNHIVYLSNYVGTDHPYYKMDHERLLAEYTPHLRKINSGFDPSWIVTSYHHKVDAAQPIVGVNSPLPGHPRPQNAVPAPLPRQHDPDIPRRQGHQLQRPHGPANSPHAHGRPFAPAPLMRRSSQERDGTR